MERDEEGEKNEGDGGGAEEGCGKLKFCSNGVLTYSERMLILVSSLEATLQDRGVEQTLFDNRIDVPESVRPHLDSSLNLP